MKISDFLLSFQDFQPEKCGQKSLDSIVQYENFKKVACSLLEKWTVQNGEKIETQFCKNRLVYAEKDIREAYEKMLVQLGKVKKEMLVEEKKEIPAVEFKSLVKPEPKKVSFWKRVFLFWKKF
jgi:hypothetical protein